MNVQTTIEQTVEKDNLSQFYINNSLNNSPKPGISFSANLVNSYRNSLILANDVLPKSGDFIAIE